MIYKGDNSINHLKEIVIRCFFASGSKEGPELFAGTQIVGPIWFLFALFGGASLYSIFKNIFSGFNLLVVVIFFFYMACVSIVKIRLPFSIQAGALSILFLYVGDLIRKHAIIFKLQNKYIVLELLLLWLISIFTGSLSMSRCEYGFGFITVIGAISASILILRYSSKLSLGGKLGKSTLYVLCFHQLSQFSHYIYGNPFELLEFSPLVSLVIEFSVELFISIFLSFAFLTIKEKLLFNKL